MLKKSSPSSRLVKNQRGNAMIELMPILMIFMLIVNFSLGFFGLIHSAILNSIGARNYTFETFRNRSNLNYLRDTQGSESSFTYTRSQQRFHVIKNETTPVAPDKFYATRRPIEFSEIREVANVKGNAGEHERGKRIREGERATEVGIDEGVNPVWIRSTYGICLVAACGG
jgi:hypothetical protein